jgi:hypothetical protein
MNNEGVSEALLQAGGLRKKGILESRGRRHLISAFEQRYIPVFLNAPIFPFKDLPMTYIRNGLLVIEVRGDRSEAE